MNESRDERIERYYQESAWDLAERIVDLEDALSALPHELAEKIRGHIKDVIADRGLGFSDRGWFGAADLIDPQT